MKLFKVLLQNQFFLAQLVSAQRLTTLSLFCKIVQLLIKTNERSEYSYIGLADFFFFRKKSKFDHAQF